MRQAFSTEQHLSMTSWTKWSEGMNDWVKTKDRASRRVLLRTAVGAISAGVIGLAGNRAAGQMKISQAAAGYQDHPTGADRCASCTHFQQPDRCQLIAGSISPQGWCRLFTPASGHAAATVPARLGRSTA
jgi:hypothetical protein